MDQATNDLIARWYLSERNYGSIEPREFADWAVAQLELGKNTPHLQMLAAEFKAPSITDVEPDFHKALAELGWKAPNQEEAIKSYAESILRLIVDGEIEPFKGCKELHMMCSYADYPEYLQKWNGLFWAEEDMSDDDLDHLIMSEAKAQLRGEKNLLIPESFNPVPTTKKPDFWSRLRQLFR